jgi:hypothetical protein
MGLTGLIIGRLDWAAWIAFGLTGLSWVGRWASEVQDEGSSTAEVFIRIE